MIYTKHTDDHGHYYMGKPSAESISHVFIAKEDKSSRPWAVYDLIPRKVTLIGHFKTLRQAKECCT